ncbi:MAG: SusD/RagB family nutrient-binding outer membrane lipoprotein, partial [Rikenellaceae bacterium]
WQKCVNTFQLKVLINLSKRADDADLKIKERFTSVMQRPIFKSNADNYQLVYSDKGGQIYPFNKVNSKHAGYTMLSSVLIDPLKQLNDYRLFHFAEPAKAIEASADSYDAYIGVNPAIPFSDIRNAYTSNNYCGLNLRYTTYAPGEPVVRIGFAEMNFIIAEAINRGIYAGNATTYYNEGIRSAMTFVSSNTPDNFNHGRKITPAYIESYITDSKVALSSDPQTQIKQIMQQKYFICLLQHKYDSYYDYRRTGLPVFPIDPETNMNQVSTTLPTRWRYPEDEYRNNQDNLNQAIKRQYDGKDENNVIMWILK